MEPSKTYHIYTHANGSENLFRNENNFRYFLKRYQEYIPSIADTFAYCLMPNHLHLMVRIKEEKILKEYFTTKNKDQLKKDQTGLVGNGNQDLSGLERLTILQFSHLFNAYTKAYNKMFKRRGSLFIRSFKRKVIESDAYFTQVIHYLHHNPIHHGFVSNLSDWSWSSYQPLLNKEPTFLHAAEVLQWFGGHEAFHVFHQKPLGRIEYPDNVLV